MAPKPLDDRAALEKAATALLAVLQARLAANVQRLRAREAWKQEEAAWRASIGLRMYQRLEGGTDVNATFWTLARLCAAYDVDVTELLEKAPPVSKRPLGRPKKSKPARSRTPSR